MICAAVLVLEAALQFATVDPPALSRPVGGQSSHRPFLQFLTFRYSAGISFIPSPTHDRVMRECLFEPTMFKNALLYTGSLERLRGLDGNRDRDRCYELLNATGLARAEVVVIGMDRPAAGSRKVDVSLKRFRRPFVLVLTCRTTCDWLVQFDSASLVRCADIVLAGEGVQSLQSNRSYEAPRVFTKAARSVDADGRPLWFHAYQHDEKNYPTVSEAIKKLYDKKVYRFIGREEGADRVWEIEGESP